MSGRACDETELARLRDSGKSPKVQRDFIWNQIQIYVVGFSKKDDKINRRAFDALSLGAAQEHLFAIMKKYEQEELSLSGLATPVRRLDPYSASPGQRGASSRAAA